MTRNHYHITLANTNTEEIRSAAKLIKGKVTEIDLTPFKEDRTYDKMITKYQTDESVIHMMRDVRTLTDAGYDVVRYKLEVGLSDDHIISRNNYVEFHVKVPAEFPRKVIPYAKFSSNPNVNGYYFYNFRAYSNSEYSKIMPVVADLWDELSERGFPFPQTHTEFVILDSKHSHDSWWL